MVGVIYLANFVSSQLVRGMKDCSEMPYAQALFVPVLMKPFDRTPHYGHKAAIEVNLTLLVGIRMIGWASHIIWLTF